MDNQSNLSPVTEAEFMSFAQRVATTLVSYSKQQGSLDHLNQVLSETTQERDHLRETNAKLNQEVGETSSLANEYSRKADEAQRHVAELEGKLRYQEEMAISRDAKVAEVQQENGNLKSTLDRTQRELETANDNHRHMAMQLSELGQDRDNWRQAAEKDRVTLSEISTKLDKIPLPIRAHFTGEEAAPKPEPVNITEHKPAPEMKPVIDATEEHPEQMPNWLTS